MAGHAVGSTLRTDPFHGAILVGLGLLLAGSGFVGSSFWEHSGRYFDAGVPWGVHVHSAPFTSYTVSGVVTGWGVPSTPLGGVNVTLIDEACGSVGPPPNCPWVNSTVTAPDGSYQFSVAPGSYIAYSDRSGRWGGAWAPVNVTGADLSLDLHAYPWVPYGNASLVLPGWNNLSAYAANCNYSGPCGTGIGGTQCPILSWTQDGVYYVNASDQLVFYSFVNGSVRDIAPWQPLYDDVMQYKGIENTEWITADGAYVYEFGCLQDCDASVDSVITFYAVNTTTGRTFLHNFTGFSDAQMRVNGEVQMLGENGNSSIAIAVTSLGTVYAFDIWGGAQWTLGHLPFFEANNVYWLPTFNSLVDVEANGSALDRLVELHLSGTPPGSTLLTTFSGTYASKFVSNGVDGLYLNLSSRRLLVSEATGGGPFETESFGYDHNGTLLGNYTTFPVTAAGSWPNDTVPPNAWSSEHRPLMSSFGPMVQGVWDGLFGNDSWQFEPATGEYLETNVSLDHSHATGKFRQNTQSPASVENLFYNSSYAILSESVNCRTNGTACPIRGTTPGTVPGTIWWTWRSGLPEFPISGPGAIAETAPPGPLTLSSTNTTRTVTVHWTGSSSDEDPPLNYTVFWGPPGGSWSHAEDVWAQNSSFTIGGLTPSVNLSIFVVAWNLHGPNAGTALSASTQSAPPGARIEGFVATPNHVDTGMQVTLSTLASGGTPPLSFSYEGLPGGCAGGNVSEFACTPTEAGTFLIVVHVQDVNGRETDASLVLNVTLALQATLLASSNVTDLGREIPLTATVGVTGAPPLLYRWTAGAFTGQGNSFQAPAGQLGAHVVLLSVSDAVGGSASTSWRYWVNADPRVSEFQAIPDPAPAGQAIHVEWVIQGGTPPTVVALSGLPAGCDPPTPNTSSWSCSPTRSGTYHVLIYVTDAMGLTATGSLGLTVTAAPPPPTGGSPLPLLAPSAILSGALAMGLLAALLQSRRVRRRPSAIPRVR